MSTANTPPPLAPFPRRRRRRSWTEARAGPQDSNSGASLLVCTASAVPSGERQAGQGSDGGTGGLGDRIPVSAGVDLVPPRPNLLVGAAAGLPCLGGRSLSDRERATPRVCERRDDIWLCCDMWARRLLAEGGPGSAIEVRMAAASKRGGAGWRWPEDPYGTPDPGAGEVLLWWWPSKLLYVRVRAGQSCARCGAMPTRAEDARMRIRCQCTCGRSRVNRTVGRPVPTIQKNGR
jgi:hypothetical protein